MTDSPSPQESPVKTSLGLGKRLLSFVWRWTRRLLKTLGILIALLLTLLALVQLTAPGRAFVLETALEQTNEIIPGHIEARRLGKLSLLGIEIWDVKITDPKGNAVIEVGHLRIDTDFSRLIRGKIALKLVQLHDAAIDARPQGPHEGIAAAFVDPDEPESPPSPGPPPNIYVDAIEVERVRALLPPLDPVGALDVRLKKLNGGFALLEGEPKARVDLLEAAALREGEEIVTASARAHLTPGDEPAQVDLQVRSGTIEIELEAQGVLLPEPGWEDKEARAKLKARGITAKQLAFLLQDPSLNDAFLGPVGVELEVAGSSNDLQGTGLVTTDAGSLRLDEFSAKGDELRAVLTTEGIVLQQLRKDLPPREVALEITAEAKGLPPDPVQVSVAVRKWTVDNQELFDVDLSGSVNGASVSGMKLRARRGDSRIDVDGDLTEAGAVDASARIDLRPKDVQEFARLGGQDLSGRLLMNAQVQRDAKGHLTTQGNAEVRDLTRPGTEEGGALSLAEAKIVFSGQGQPPALSGRIDADLKKLKLDDQYIDEARLQASGTVSDLNVHLEATGGAGPPSPDGTRRKDQTLAVNLDAHMERQGSETVVSAQGKAQVQGTEMDLDVSPTRISDSGRIETEGIEVRVGDQPITATGSLSATGASEGIDIVFGPIDLDSIPQVTSQVADITGVVSGRARIEGSSRVPIVEVEVQGSKLGLKKRPLSDLKFRGRLDAQTGTSELALDLTSKEGLKLQSEVAWSFSPGEGYVAALPGGEGEVRLQVEELNTSFVRPYLSATLPLPDASLKSTILFQGSVAEPRLTTTSDLDLAVAEKSVGRVHHTLKYGQGRLKTAVQVRDTSGPWLKTDFELDLGGTLPATELGDAFARAATDAQWKLRADTKSRNLATLSLVPLAVNPQDLPAVRFETTLSASHAPLSEPEIEFGARLRHEIASQEQGGWSQASCGSHQVDVIVRAKHEGSNNEVVVTAHDRKQKLLELEARLPLALSPVLGGEDPSAGSLDLDLLAEKLDLSSLPLVCGNALGTVTAKAKGRDLLGTSPELDLNIDAFGLSAGTRDSLNVQLRAHADSSELKASGKIQGSGRHRDASGNFGLQLPWKFSEAKLELDEKTPLDAHVRLSKMPIAPLLPPGGEISYASGTIDLTLKADGALDAPELSGDIELQNIAFTSTSVAQPLRGVKGNIALRGRRIVIEHLEARDRDGLLTLEGEIDLRDMEALKARIDIDAKDFPLRQKGQVVAVTNLSATATTSVTDEATIARLELKEVDTWLESVTVRSGIKLEAHPDFQVDGAPTAPTKPDGKSPTKSQAEKGNPKKGTKGEKEEITVQDEEGRLVTITIDARDRFWVKRSDFAVKLETLLEAKIQDEEVRVQGDVTIDRGYLQLFGKVFDLTRESQLRFTGSSPPDPALELEAAHDTRGGSTVSVTITGRSSEPVLTFFVDGDEVEAGQAVQELFGGQKGGGDGSDASSQAQSFVGGLTAGVLATAARRELGSAAPIVMIDPADKAGEGRVRAGFELDDIVPKFLQPIVTGVYLEGIAARESDGAASAQTQFGALLEFYFPKNFFTAGQYGPGSTWSVDFGWQL